MTSTQPLQYTQALNVLLIVMQPDVTVMLAYFSDSAHPSPDHTCVVLDNGPSSFCGGVSKQNTSPVHINIDKQLMKQFTW